MAFSNGRLLSTNSYNIFKFNTFKTALIHASLDKIVSSAFNYSLNAQFYSLTLFSFIPYSIFYSLAFFVNLFTTKVLEMTWLAFLFLSLNFLSGYIFAPSILLYPFLLFSLYIAFYSNNSFFSSLPSKIIFSLCSAYCFITPLLFVQLSSFH